MKIGFESEAGGATGLCEQGEGGFRPPLLSLVFSTGRGAP